MNTQTVLANAAAPVPKADLVRMVVLDKVDVMSALKELEAMTEMVHFSLEDLVTVAMAVWKTHFTLEKMMELGTMEEILMNVAIFRPSKPAM